MKKRVKLLLGILTFVLLLGACKKLPVEEGSNVVDGIGNSVKEEDKGENEELGKDTSTEEFLPEEGAVLKFRSSDKEFAKAIAEKFYEKYGVQVLTEEGGLYDFSKGVLEGATGEGPDVFMSPHDKTLEGIGAGIYLEFDNKLVDNLKNEISEVAMKTVTVDGKVYGVPVSIETNVMFYNKDLVTGEPANSFEQIKEEALAYNDTKNNKFWFLSNVCEGSPIFPMLSTYGFRLFGENGADDNKPGFETEEFLKGLSVLADYKSIMPIPSGDLANADFLTTQFMEGKTAYIIGGPWNVKALREAGVNFGVTKLVTYDGRQQYPFSFVQNAHVSAYTKYPKAAQLLAEFLVSKEGAELLYTKASKISSRANPSEISGLKDDLDLIAITEAFNNSVPMPSAKRISYYWTISANIGPAVFDGKMTAEEGAKKAVDDWNAFLQAE